MEKFDYKFGDIFRRCPECGKQFGVVFPGDWAYKDQGALFCSWKCLRAWEKRQAVLRGEKAKEESSKKKKIPKIIFNRVSSSSGNYLLINEDSEDA